MMQQALDLLWTFFLTTWPWPGVAVWLVWLIVLAMTSGRWSAEQGGLDSDDVGAVAFLAFVGGLFCLIWPVPVIASVLGLVWWFFASLSGRVYRRKAAKHTKQHADLLASAATWQGIADDSAQIEDTRAAARAAAQAFRGQADEIVLLKVDGKTPGSKK